MYKITADNDILTNAMTNLIKSQINEIPPPTQCEITTIHNDGTVDIHSKEYGDITFINTITSHEIGDKTVLLFLDNDYNKRIVI